jgi:branched-chain amino acid transport system ATP-binding protein
MSLLEVTGLNSYYGDSHILFDVALRVEQNEVVALLGRNGAGKSTTLKSLMGVVTPRAGSILFDGAEIAGKKSHAIAQAGMQLVHEDRRIFGSLNVEENLVLAGLTAPNRWPLDRVYAMFPRLKERRLSRGTDLSGGEQQMLAIARGIMSDPEVLIIDELSLGLAPVVVQQLTSTLKALKQSGMTILLVEQNVQLALALSDYAYVIAEGRAFMEGSSAEVPQKPEIRQAYLGL